MNDSQNNQNNDFKNVNAVVIGELRKDKIGRPILVAELFVIILIVMISLPFLSSMLDDENSSLYKLLHGSSTPVVQTPTNKSEYSDARVKQPLNSQTSMKYGSLILKKFVLSRDKINVTISSYNGILNLDEEAYYLNLYSSSDNLLAHIKLVGEYDNSEKQVSLTSSGLSFNSDMSYKGMVVEMKDSDYPNVSMETDETGIGSFICKKDNRSIEYIFKNNYLIGIKDNVIVNISSQETTDDYLNLKRIYDEKASSLGSVATNEEGIDGFTFSANMDLENYRIPDGIKDYEYYALDTEAKIVHYTETGKGFDCE